MVRFELNGQAIHYSGNPDKTLLQFLRQDKHITSVKDGCSAQAACGSCTVEIDGRARLSCTTKIKSLEGSAVYTMEGIPEYIRDTIAKTFVNQGAVQCGFCTPGFILRLKVLLQHNPAPSIHEIRQALKPHLCRCTGYKKIEQAAEHAAQCFEKKEVVEIVKTTGKIGTSHPRYQAYETAIGKKQFMDDIFIEGMLYAALKFTEYPCARVIHLNTDEAQKLDGVHRIFTASDIPGKHKTGLIIEDWPLMIGVSEKTNYIGDVIAGVVAESDEIARKAVSMIQVEYEVYQPVTDVFDAIDTERIHPERPNNFETTRFKIGQADEFIAKSDYTYKNSFRTQRVEHAFLEKESAIAFPDDKGGIVLLSQGQGIYEDRRQVASLLGIPVTKVRVKLIATGGAFGGKEDLSVQGHASLFSFLVQKPVKLSLSREESIRLHPKRHPVYMDIELASDKFGKLTALKLRAVGDTGAYASIGAKVMERIAGHASGAYYIPHIDVETKTVYTNNIPSGAMRGFGANQVIFALESCIDEICKLGNFDRWKFRYDNALKDGLTTSTGQKVFGVGVRSCLEAIKEDFYQSTYTGIACAIKNSGVGNGMIDESKVKIEIISEKHILIHHGWTEMGQGVNNMAIQVLCQETGLDPNIMEVEIDTNSGIKTGMTTSSRATALLGLAVIDAAKLIKQDLEKNHLKNLAGKVYCGQFVCDWTNKPDASVKNPVVHYSYGYAAQLCILDDNGHIKKIIAAHDAGKILNPLLFEGQMEGAVHMGLGYVLSEDLPMIDGYLVSDNMNDLQILRAHETPEIQVIGIEVPDPVGPYGAKGIGEIGLIPTAAAVANAFCAFDGQRRLALPIKRKNQKKVPK